MNIPIIFEDNWLLVVDKPTGLLVIPTPKKEKRTLTSILNEEFKSRGAEYNLHPCHRLDREASGLIIYAKGKSTQKKITELFRQKKIIKAYIAFVQGHPREHRGIIKNPVEGQNAVTNYEIIESRKDFDIVKVMPLTGRTNQIRIHFRSLGHPLVGESKFAFRKDYALKAKRVCLHALALKFTHPITSEAVNLSCVLAQDLEKFLKTHPD
ncbi:MAG: RNA pseudouridine synthase [Candidatus Omnitrophota bacterium]